ncbi:carbohydrate kinase [Parabacteroides sp. 52]|uniref:carbohydrate kinase family protein n=1 Tax=unclassified Parabacteroides TaxID=2649774 RepID=UPI0013D312BF|nr:MULTISPECIES: carbohydrate kinase [unclassified Parabacteroides]MDH6535431.1 fructokinase [Parabacteroides sp. PM5-20]NDV56074.1 carbohydrate kinase [Parabacteroides sp. 52]
MRKVIGVGETILDIIFKDNQPHAAIPGGTVFNGFVSLARMGVPVSFISELGNDRVGEILRSFMAENNISSDFIDCFPDGKSPLALAFLDDEQNASYLIYKDYPAQRLEVALPQINEDDIFIIGSYYALNPALRERMFEFLRYAQERKAIIYYDPNFRKPHAHESLRLRPAVIENLEFADIVRGSNEDFFYLFGETDMQEVYEQYIRFYCDRLIVTQGSGKISLFDKERRESFDVPSLTPVSTVGAGDNFNAGFIYGLLKYNIRRKDLSTLDREGWERLIRCGIDLSTQVCGSYENYISKTFAERYAGQY